LHGIVVGDHDNPGFIRWLEGDALNSRRAPQTRFVHFLRRDRDGLENQRWQAKRDGQIKGFSHNKG
jgi:hypothetical protein